jgi:hypothetical protein
MFQSTRKYVVILGSTIFLAGAGSLIHRHIQETINPSPFWDTIPDNQASYIYAPGLIGSEILMGRYCPEYTAGTGEKVSWKVGGHVIGKPHTGVNFPDANLKKPTCFTLNPLTILTNNVRQDLFPIIERFFNEKYGITVVDNPKSTETVANYTPNFAAANIGQKKDINVLRKKYKEHILKYPNTNIILYGDSRGAATSFNFIALHKPEQVKAAVLEGIFDTVPHCVKHFLYDDKSPEAEKCLHNLLSLIAWKYNKNGINPHKCAEFINDDIPLLFVTSLKDGLVPPQGTIGLYKRLKERGHKKIHLLVLKKSLHPAYMIDDPEDRKIYEAAVHAFYKQYNLPHNSSKAALGKTEFSKSQPEINQLATLYPLPKCALCI